MMFKKLYLKNFKSYEESVIDLNPGISIILGENGAGKSSILEAISFALFKQHTAKKIDDLVRNASKKNMVIELDFISNGQEYKIRREKAKNGLKSIFFKKTSLKGEFIPSCAGDKEVANEINSILDIDSNLFLNAIYIRQGEISELVDKTSSEKKQLIGKLLGIDSLEKSWKNILPFINKYEKEKAELKGKLYSSSKLNEEYKDKISILNNLKKEGHSLESDIQEVKELKAIKSGEKLKMEAEKEIYDTLVNNLRNEKEIVESLEIEKKTLTNQLDEIYKNEEEIKKLETSIKKLPLYLEFEKSVRKIHDLKLEENDIKRDLESIKEQKEILEIERKGYENFINIEDELDSLKKTKSELENELRNVTQLEKDKKLLLSEIEDNRNDIDDFFKKCIEILEKESIDSKELETVADFKQLKYTNSKFIKEIENKTNEIDNKIKTKNEEIAGFKETIKSSKKPLKELADVDNKCPLCQSEIDFKKKDDLIKLYNGNIKSNESSIKENKEDIRLLNKNKTNFEDKIKKLQKLNEDIIEYNHKFSDLEKDLDTLKKIDKDLEAKDKVSSKLGEIIISIGEENVKREEYKKSYDKFNKAQGALEVLGSETDTEYKLTQNRNDIDIHVKNIKIAINKDSHLSSDIDEEDLQDRIDILKKKEEKYNQLKGYVKIKKALEAQLTSKKEDINWKINKINNIKREIGDSKYNKDKYDRLVYSFDVATQRYEDLNAKLNKLKGQATELINSVEELTAKIASNDKFKKEYENIDEYLKLLIQIRELYSKNGIQKDLRNRSRPLIQKYTKDFFEQFNFNYSDLILDEDYNVSVFGPEGESSLSMVSGGEKIAMALALRLGITQAMSNGDLETILLDEPTIHLDSYRRHELINLLKEMSVLPQMIIVTHENQLENAADNIIKVEKENGISKVEVES